MHGIKFHQTTYIADWTGSKVIDEHAEWGAAASSATSISVVCMWGFTCSVGDFEVSLFKCTKIFGFVL